MKRVNGRQFSFFLKNTAIRRFPSVIIYLQPAHRLFCFSKGAVTALSKLVNKFVVNLGSVQEDGHG
jgi:hypothetical protein